MPLSDKISLVYIKPNIKMFCYSYQLTFKSPASALVAVAKATEMLHLQTTGIYGVSNYSSWCLNTFLTSILVWEVLTPILDLLGKLKGNGFLWNNRSKWNILAKGSIRCGYITFFQVNLHYLFFFFFPELQLCWANLRGENWELSAILPMVVAIISKWKLSRYVYWICTYTSHVLYHDVETLWF